MSSKWADEVSGHEPDPKLEDFYLLVALRLGSPMGKEWIIEKAREFHQMYREWRPVHMNENESGTVLLQYILWYERDGPERQRS